MKKLILSIALMGVLTCLVNLIEGCTECTFCPFNPTTPQTFCNGFTIDVIAKASSCSRKDGSIKVKICNNTITPCAAIVIVLILNESIVNATLSTNFEGKSCFTHTFRRLGPGTYTVRAVPADCGGNFCISDCIAEVRCRPNIAQLFCCLS